MGLSVSTFFQYYMFFPIDAPKPRQRWVALTATIALGILTGGILHAICALASFNRRFMVKEEWNLLEKKTYQVFEESIKEAKSEEEIEKCIKKGENLQKWVDVVKKSAREEDRNFQYLLGKLYKSGNAVLEQSDNLSFFWFQKAAKQGHVKAQYQTAVMYHSGKAVEKSLKKAAKYYLLAATGGNSSAQFSIGRMYHTGDGGFLRSAENAAEWYEKASLQGNSKALNNLGVMYYNGEGVDESRPLAIYCLKEAARLGNQSAVSNLEEILQAKNEEKKEKSKD